MFLLIFLVAITVQHYDELGIFWIEWMNDIKSYKNTKQTWSYCFPVYFFFVSAFIVIIKKHVREISCDGSITVQV